MRSPADRGADQLSVDPGPVTAPVAGGRVSRREIGACAGIVLVALAMRLYGVGARPLFWQDELGLLEYILTGDATWLPQEAPLYSRLQFVWMWWIHTPTANTMRLLSIGLGVLGVMAAFVLGRLIAGPRVGLLAAALLSVSPMALALAHEVRPYTLFILVSTLLLACFLVAWQRNTPKAWLGYGVALTATLFTHLLATQLCLALGITALAATRFERHQPGVRARFTAFAATSVAFGLLGLSWVGFHHDRGAILVGPYGPGPLDFIQASITSLGGSVESQLPIAIATAALAGLGLVVLCRRQPVHAILFASVIGVSCIINYATMEEMSAWGWNNWQRYLSHLLVPYLVLISIGTLWLARIASARLSGLPASLLASAITLTPLLLVVPGAWQWLQSPDRHPHIGRISHYATFACEHQHEVVGLIYVKGMTLKAPGISTLYTRQYYGYEQVRHDSLTSFLVGNEGVKKIVERPGRGNIGTIPEYVALSRPPADGHYVVFPPGVGCEALAARPNRGVNRSVEVTRGHWGLICDLHFQR